MCYEPGAPIPGERRWHIPSMTVDGGDGGGGSHVCGGGGWAASKRERKRGTHHRRRVMAVGASLCRQLTDGATVYVCVCVCTSAIGVFSPFSIHFSFLYGLHLMLCVRACVSNCSSSPSLVLSPSSGFVCDWVRVRVCGCGEVCGELCGTCVLMRRCWAC